MGWIIWHRTTPPLRDGPPRPCLHAHLVIAALMRTPDGEWADITAASRRAVGGYLPAVDAYAGSRLRRLLTDRHGLTWERDRITGRWEIASASADLYANFPHPPPLPRSGHPAVIDGCRSPADPASVPAPFEFRPT
jgi:hypothetical protein